MGKARAALPTGNSGRVDIPVRSAADIGRLVREARRAQGLTQLELAGLGDTGNRFVVELEKGKPTIQLQKALDALALLGLEVVIRPLGPVVVPSALIDLPKRAQQRAERGRKGGPGRFFIGPERARAARVKWADADYDR